LNKYRVAFGDIKIGEVARANVNRALDVHWISQGENVQAFEEEFAAKFGFKEAIATSNGTASDMAACMALYEYGAKRGDEVIVPACCFVACANSILAAGFIPRFVDVELETLNINPQLLKKAITDNTAGIMVVHNMGKPCKMNEINAMAAGIPVIEDCCEAHGALHWGHLVGRGSHISTFSFYAAHLIVGGEGGMVGVQDKDLAKIIRSVISHGRPPGSIYFDFQRFGLNLRMHELAAAIAREGLQNFDQTFRDRRERLFYLRDKLNQRGLGKFMHFIEEGPQEIVAPHAFPLVLRDLKGKGPNAHKFDNASLLYSWLEENSIQTKTLFGCLPAHPAFRWMLDQADTDCGSISGRPTPVPSSFPVAEYIARRGMHFGIHQYLSFEDLDYVADVMGKYFEGVEVE
jgi:dTDP-4-amino-4,6-dideoxygalactose transaminase